MTTDTTPAAIEKLLKDVTPGPWGMETVRTSCGVCHKIGPWPHQWRHGADMSACIYDDYPSSSDGTGSMLANARFIAAARDLVPALAAERDAAFVRAENAETEAAARIRSALTVQPSPDVAGLVEALRSTLNFIENTEGEMGVILGCGDKARAALAALKGAANE